MLNQTTSPVMCSKDVQTSWQIFNISEHLCRPNMLHPWWRQCPASITVVPIHRSCTHHHKMLQEAHHHNCPLTRTTQFVCRPRDSMDDAIAAIFHLPSHRMLFLDLGIQHHSAASVWKQRLPEHFCNWTLNFMNERPS